MIKCLSVHQYTILIAVAWSASVDVGVAGQWDDIVTYDDVQNKPYKYGPNDDWNAGKAPFLGVQVDARTGNGTGGTVWIPLDTFARENPGSAANAKQTDANTKQIQKNTKMIAQNTAAIQEQAKELDALNAKVRNTEEKNNSNVAAMGAIDFQRPLPGKAMRAALGAAESGEKAGVGVSLSLVKGDLDVSLGVGVAENATVAKGSVGFSFF